MTVYLVGAGPGDPDLLTVKAVKLLEQADCILYDSLVNEDILRIAPANCQKIYVGKRLGRHSVSQEKIHDLMLGLVKAGRTVIRLKGGDPFIFGRGGEELEFLDQHGIAIEVVPGVTAAAAAAASLQVPLTHRQHGQSVIFLSGYSKNAPNTDKDQQGLPGYDWQNLATSSLTLVFYMGLHHLGNICKALAGNGMQRDTPVAVVSRSSLPDEKVLLGTIDSIATDVEREAIAFPALVIIGDVLNLKPQATSNTSTPQKRERIEPTSTGQLLILFHGATSLQSSTVPSEFVRQLRARLKKPEIEFAFLTEKFTPNYKERFADFVEAGVQQVDIWPIFLLPGKHLDEDIPRILVELQAQYPNIQINLWPAPDIIENLLAPLGNMAANLLDARS